MQRSHSFDSFLSFTKLKHPKKPNLWNGCPFPLHSHGLMPCTQSDILTLNIQNSTCFFSCLGVFARACTGPTRYSSACPAAAAPARRSPALGCTFRFVFRFLTGLIFWNPRTSTDYFQFRRTHVGLNHSRARLMFQNLTESGTGIPGGRTLKGATCNKNTAGRLKNHNKSRCQ